MSYILISALFLLCGVMGMIAIQEALVKCWKASGLALPQILPLRKSATLSAVYSTHPNGK